MIQTHNYKHKYLKYKQKYLELRGGKFTEQTIDQLIDIFKNPSDYSTWKYNLIKYHKKNIAKLKELEKQYEVKVNDKIEIDKHNRIKTMKRFNQESTDDDYNFAQDYIAALKKGVDKPIEQYIASLNDVAVYTKIIEKFQYLVDEITSDNGEELPSTSITVSSVESKKEKSDKTCYSQDGTKVIMTKEILDEWKSEPTNAKKLCIDNFNLKNQGVSMAFPNLPVDEKKKSLRMKYDDFLANFEAINKNFDTKPPDFIVKMSTRIINETLDLLGFYTTMNGTLVGTQVITENLTKIILPLYNKSIEHLNPSKQEIQKEHKIKFNFNFKQYIEKFCEICNKNKENPALIPFIKNLLSFMLSIFMNNDVEAGFNVIITGNPGIGKSYAALKIAEIFKYSYLLPAKDTLINVKKPDVIGQHVGQTAPKTYSILRQGIGNVVFIDEAYSFAGEKKPGHGYDQFGLEFLNALTDFLMEHQGLLCVVAAGYKKEMDTQFLEANPGLDRRFINKINLERYPTSYLKIEFNKNLVKQMSSQIKCYLMYYKKLNKYLEDIINLFDLQLDKYKDADTLHNDISKNIFFAFVNSNDYTDCLTETLVPTIDNKILVKSIPCGKNILNFEAYKNEYIVDYVYYLNKLNIPNGDLFSNQYADIKELVNIVIDTISSYYVNIEKDIKNKEKNYFNKIIISIIKNYISHKSQNKLRYQRDYIITAAKINGESNKKSDEKIAIFFKCNELERLYELTTINTEIIKKMETDTRSFSQFNINELSSVKSYDTRNYSDIENTAYEFIESYDD
jgi:hypothetical protein